MRESSQSSQSAGRRLDVGGVALENGLLLQGPRHWVLAVCLPDERISVASGVRPVVKGPLGSLPFVRGIARLAETLAVYGQLGVKAPRSILPSNLKRMAAATALSIVASRLLRSRSLPVPLFVKELLIAALAVIPAAAATVRGASIGRYHAVEHKAVAAYQRSGEALYEALAAAPKEHPNCGSNLAALLIGTTAITNAVARRPSRAVPPGVQLAIGAINLAATLEIFRWSARNREHPLARLLLAPGMSLQRYVTTDEPTPRELAVGQAALAELLRLETGEATHAV